MDTIHSTPALWLPTEEEVAQWLTQYRERCMASGARADAAKIKPIEGFDFAKEQEDSELRIMVKDGKTVMSEETREWFDSQEGFFATFEEFQSVRRMVGMAQGLGYCTGRDGGRRESCTYTGPSDQAFAWHNGWLTGANDRRIYG